MRLNYLEQIVNEIVDKAYRSSDLEILGTCKNRLLNLLCYGDEEGDLNRRIFLDIKYIEEKERRIKNDSSKLHQK